MPCPELLSKYCLFKTEEKLVSAVWIASREVELITIAIISAKGIFCEIGEACSTPRAVNGGSSREKSFDYIVDGFGIPDDDETISVT